MGDPYLAADAHAAGRSDQAAPFRPILVVEDDHLLRSIIIEALILEGLPAIGAANGANALEVVARHAPAAIILDLGMPVMDGRAFLTAYRARPGPYAPIIVCSARVPQGDLAGQLGAAAVVDKPFDLMTLLDVVRCVVPA